MNNHEVIIQKALEKERKIQNLNNLLVNQFDKAIHTGNALTNGQDVIISFDIQCITSELRDLFFERLNILWGEISNDAPLEKRKYFYCRQIKVDGNTVTAKLIKNW